MRSELLLPLLLTLGCVSSTGGERVSFQAQALPVAPVTELAGEPAIQWHDDSTDTDIVLTEARVWLGPVYLWSDEPALDVDGWTSRLVDVVIPRAHAAADQFTAGFLRAELTEQVEIDLLQEQAQDLGWGTGLAGPSLSGELWLEPPPSGHTLSLAGVATLADDSEVPFVAELSFDDSWLDLDEGDNPLRLRRLRGLLWDAELAEGGTLVVTADARAWLRGADFAELLSQEPDALGRYALLPDNQPGRVLSTRVRSVASTGPWALEWQAP